MTSSRQNVIDPYLPRNQLNDYWILLLFHLLHFICCLQERWTSVLRLFYWQRFHATAYGNNLGWYGRWRLLYMLIDVKARPPVLWVLYWGKLYGLLDILAPVDKTKSDPGFLYRVYFGVVEYCRQLLLDFTLLQVLCLELYFDRPAAFCSSTISPYEKHSCRQRVWRGSFKKFVHVFKCIILGKSSPHGKRWEMTINFTALSRREWRKRWFNYAVQWGLLGESKRKKNISEEHFKVSSFTVEMHNMGLKKCC